MNHCHLHSYFHANCQGCIRTNRSAGISTSNTRSSEDSIFQVNPFANDIFDSQTASTDISPADTSSSDTSSSSDSFSGFDGGSSGGGGSDF